MVSRFEQFSCVISGINNRIQKIQRSEMIKCGYKGAFAHYLITLSRYEDGLNASEICEICNKDKAAVSRVVAEMEELGLVERKHKKLRSYRSTVKLTEKGKETAAFVAERAKIAVEAVSGELMDEKTREEFYAILDSILRNLQQVSVEGLPQE